MTVCEHDCYAGECALRFAGRGEQADRSLSPGPDAGTLEDQRQSDLSQLSQLIGVNQIITESNGLSITTSGGQLLVSEGSAFQITTANVSGLTHLLLNGTDITTQLDSGGGQLGGLLTARDQSIPNTLASRWINLPMACQRASIGDEAGEVKDIFFNRHIAADYRRVDPRRCAFV